MQQTFLDIIYKIFYDTAQRDFKDVRLLLSEKFFFPSIQFEPKIEVRIPIPKKTDNGIMYSGYLFKDSEPELLLANIIKVLAGKLVVTDKLSEFLNELDQEDNIREKLANLTKREQQIISEVAKGLSNKEISESLHISEGTVKVHVKSLLKKLAIKSRVEAAVLYLQQPK